MKKNFFRAAVAAVLALVFTTASPVYADLLNPDPERSQYASAGEIAGDFLIIRPATFTAMVVGAGFFAVTSPFTLLSRNIDRSAEVFVVRPALYTFRYPIGSY